MSNLAKVHCTGATGQLFGQQPEATDRLGRSGLRFRLSFGSLGQLGTEEFFVFVQKIKAHCVSILLGPLGAGVKKAARTRYAAWAAALSTPASGWPFRAQPAPRRT